MVIDKSKRKKNNRKKRVSKRFVKPINDLSPLEESNIILAMLNDVKKPAVQDVVIEDKTVTDEATFLRALYDLGVIDITVIQKYDWDRDDNDTF